MTVPAVVAAPVPAPVAAPAPVGAQSLCQKYASYRANPTLDVLMKVTIHLINLGLSIKFL